VRTLNSDALALLSRAQAGERIAMAQLLELQLTATQYLTTSGHSLTWNGHTWVATGMLLEPITDTATEWSGITIVLPGVTEAQLALALSEPVEGKVCKVYDALVDPTTGAVVDAVLAWSGTLSVASLEDGPKATVSISAEHRATLAFRVKASRYTNDEQQRLHPGDTCLDYDPQTDAAPIAWPAASFFRQ
jgi:hypothetical protein